MGALKKYYQPKLSTRLGVFMVKIATYFFCTGKWETWILINFFGSVAKQCSTEKYICSRWYQKLFWVKKGKRSMDTECAYQSSEHAFSIFLVLFGNHVTAAITRVTPTLCYFQYRFGRIILHSDYAYTSLFSFIDDWFNVPLVLKTKTPCRRSMIVFFTVICILFYVSGENLKFTYNSMILDFKW